MAMYSLNLMRIALELAEENHVYEDVATKFFEHFLYIAEAMASHAGHAAGLWDEADGFFYDVLHLPDGRETRLKVRSLVGLIPLFAVEVVDDAVLRRLPEFAGRLRWFLDYRPDLASLVSRWHHERLGAGRELAVGYVADVVAGGEHAFAAGEHDAAGVEPPHRLGDRVEDLVVERVALG